MKNTRLQQLKALRNDARLGARSIGFQEEAEAKLMAAIGHASADASTRYSFAEYVAYYRATMLPVAARSFAGVAAAVVLLMSGWFTTVSAASQSLPGDALYGFKLITEQAQLRVVSLERRAVLHTEFAGRRLREAVTLQKSGNASDAQNIESAFTAFKREVTSANSDLQELRIAGSEQAVETAGRVEEQLSTFDVVLNESVAVSVDAAATASVQEAQDLSREAQSAAVSVVVDTHEESETDQTTRELQAIFLRELGDLEGRQTFDLHRVTVIRNAIAANDMRLDTEGLPTTSELGALEKDIKEVGNRVAEAMDAYTAGEYRTAFESLHNVGDELSQIEFRMAQVEILITQALSAETDSSSTETESEVLVEKDDSTH